MSIDISQLQQRHTAVGGTIEVQSIHSWSPRGTIGSESRDLYACSVVACSAEGDAARKARLGHCDDVVCSMRLRFPDAVYCTWTTVSRK